MHKASILLAIGGDTGNTVPKHNVTPAEVAVLRHIHGDDAVTDIKPTGDLKRTNREERQRLAEVYGRRDDKGRHVAPAVDALFPGAATRVFETFDELDLPEELYKAATRVKHTAQPEPAVEEEVPAADETVDETVDEPVAETGDATEEPGGETEDGIGEINDGNGGNDGESLFE